MKRLSKSQETARAQLINDLREATKKVVDQKEEINMLIREKLNPAIDSYNEALSGLAEYRDEVVSEMETYFDERSDGWREGDAGSTYEEWKGEWENADLSEVENVSEVELDDPSHADEVEGLSSEPGA